MTRATESKIRAIFSKHIEKACDEITEEVSAYWPADCTERLAEMVTQAIALMDESTENLREEEGG